MRAAERARFGARQSDSASQARRFWRSRSLWRAWAASMLLLVGINGWLSSWVLPENQGRVGAVGSMAEAESPFSWQLSLAQHLLALDPGMENPERAPEDGASPGGDLLQDLWEVL